MSIRSAVVLSFGVFLVASPLHAQTNVALPPITIGAGMQTSFVNTSPDEGDSTNNFLLNSVRLYVNGSATDKIKVMFNTEYDSNNHVNVLDAAGRFEMAPNMNIWVGRFLPPSDRANMYGPYYAHHWNVFTDGVQDGYPFVAAGRANGAMYWGQFDKLKVSAGAFDGPSLAAGFHSTKVLWAGRAQYDFWDAEGGYYLNGTYYGGKNLLAIGGAFQAQGGESGADTGTAYSGDFLLERKISDSGGSFSIEAELAKYDKLGGYSSHYQTNTGGYVLGSYLFPNQVGMGKFELLGKFANADLTKGITAADADANQKTTEVNVNYIIKEFNARLMFFFLHKDCTVACAAGGPGNQTGIGIQLQM